MDAMVIMRQIFSWMVLVYFFSSRKVVENLNHLDSRLFQIHNKTVAQVFDSLDGKLVIRHDISSSLEPCVMSMNIQ